MNLMKMHVLSLALLLVAPACGAGGDAGSSGTDTATASDVTRGPDRGVPELPTPDYRPVVFAVITDIHIEGGVEHGISQNVAGLLQDLAALEPAPELVAITGDLIDAFEEPVDMGSGSKLEALRQIFEGSPLPVEVALGNHDYYVTGETLIAITPDRAARERLWEDELGIPPWHATTHGGMRFVHLNSMAGPKAADSLGLNGSMGQEQLEWLDALLDDGVRSILFFHHPPASVLDEGERDLAGVVQSHADAVLAIFVGHIHVWGRDEFEGVPVYLTSAGYGGHGHHHVRVDPAAGTVEILNADGVDYGETEVIPCDPAREPGLPEPVALEGIPQVLRIPDAHVSPMGLGTYLREVVSELPLVVRLGAAGGDEVAALVTVGTRVGDPADAAPAYVKPMADGPCAATFLALNGPCFSTAPVDLVIEIGDMLGFPLPPGWSLHAALTELTLSGVLAEDGTVGQGVLKTTLDFEPGARDVEAILVQEYCKGSLTGCAPGAEGMPPCPEEPGPEFFSEVPQECDVNLLGFGLRILFEIVESVPDLRVQLDANFTVWPAKVLGEPAAGGISPALFAPAPEGTCPVD